MLSKKLEEIMNRQVEIRNLLDSDAKVNLEDIKTELAQLEKNEKEIRSKQEVRNSLTEVRTLDSKSKVEYDEAGEYRNAFVKTLQGKILNPVETRAMDTTTGSAGYAIPETMQNDIYRAIEAKSDLYNLVSKTFVKGNFTILKAPASADCAWHTENADVASDDTVIPVKLTFEQRELIKVIKISRAALNMTVSSFDSYLVNEIATKMAKAINAAILTGNGTTAPKGILTETLETTTFTTNLSYANLISAFGNFPSEFANNAKFVCNRKTFFNQVLGMEDADGNPIVHPDVSAPAKYSVLGMPVVIDGLIVDDTIIIGDLSMYHLNYQEGVSVVRNDSVGLTSGTIAYVGYASLDGKVIDVAAFAKIVKA